MLLIMQIKNVIVKRGTQWYVYSHDRKKKLGGPYKTKSEAVTRLRQVEGHKKNESVQNMSKNKRHFRNAVFNLQCKSVRNEKLNNRDYLVVPMVMLTEGVHCGNEGPYLYTADELSKRPQVWNMKPVVVYHPDEPTACSADVLNTRGIGVIMNTKWDGRLTAEAWLEKERCDEVDKRILAAVENEQMLELSTGLYADSDEEEGVWNAGDYEEEYQGTLHNIAPDHLAILPDQIGACSCEDGAGFFRNMKNEKVKLSRGWMQYFNELSSNDLREQLDGLVYVKGEYTYVIDTEPDSNTFVYERNEKLYRQSYTVDGDTVALEGLPEAVVRKVSYVPVQNKNDANDISNKESNNMKKSELIAQLISNEDTQWTEDDQEFLEGHTVDVLKKFAPIKNEADDSTDKTEDKDEKDDTVDNQQKQVSNQQEPQTVEEALNGLPEPIQNTLRESLARDEEERQSLISVITKNERCKFTKDDLQPKSLKELRNLAALAAPEKKEQHVNNYGGQGDPADVADDVPDLPLPKLNFSKAS